MTYPPKLKFGDKIAIIAPSSPVSVKREVAERGFGFLQKKGFKLDIPDSIFRSKRYTAGTPEFRAKLINGFFADKSIKAIIAFWGGWNANQILDKLDYRLIANNPKIFIGYSDITAISTAITTKSKIVTYSGPGVISYAKPDFFEYTWQMFEKMCIDAPGLVDVFPSERFEDDIFFTNPNPNKRRIKNNRGVSVLRHGVANGGVVAGNLQTLLLLSGTGYFPDIKNKILIIEEAEGENTSKIDRFLTALSQLNDFENIHGLIIGKFMEDSGLTEKHSQKAFLEKIFKKFKFPIIYDFNYGHTDPIATIPNGGICHIDTRRSYIRFRS